MSKKSRKPKAVAKRVKQKEWAESKVNYTFRLSERLMEAFKAKCENEGISMAAAIHELLLDFIKG